MLTKTLADLDLAAEWGRARVPWLHDRSKWPVSSDKGVWLPSANY
jgi:hypothetical protein